MANVPSALRRNNALHQSSSSSSLRLAARSAGERRDYATRKRKPKWHFPQLTWRKHLSRYTEMMKIKKGMYRLSKEAFKFIAGKASLKDAYLWEVDAALREDGFMTLDMRAEHNQIAIISMTTIIKKFQELSEGLVAENACPSDDDEW